MQLLIATMNRGKIREFREILGQEGISWDDLSAHPDLAAAEETGRTFRANACQKAAHYARILKMHAVADDSGLEVDALGGSPGVHSARWAAVHHAGNGDVDNNALLLRQLENVPDERRTARFVCVLAMADPQGRAIYTARETVEGRIIHEPRGDNGFGYDPLFFVHEHGKTMAELESGQKHQISHRGKALRRLRAIM